jgi:D-alanyl-D-alanine carboxypeptidase
MVTLPRVAAGFLIVVCGLVTACSRGNSAEPNDTPTSSVSTSAAGSPECPESTTPEQGLCVAFGETAEEVAALISTSFREARFEAMIVGVWKDGKPVVVGALGDSMTGVAATIDMHHRIGNVSAPFLTTVFMQLVDEGVLALDDPLSKWFPDVPEAEKVTLEQLARSMSGYEHHPSNEAFLEALDEDPFRAWEPEELITFGTAGGTAFEPGTGFQFSDTNLLLLGEVIAKETGTSTHELIKERIIEPLGLDNTTSPQTAEQAEPVLHGYTDEREVWEDATYWNPSWVPYGGDMASNQRDVARWMEALAAGDLLSQEAHEELLAPVTVGLGPNTQDLYYAMGVGVTNGWVFANPSLQGYQAAVGREPDADATIVIYASRTPEADESARQDMTLFQSLGELLAPEQPPAMPSRFRSSN